MVANAKAQVLVLGAPKTTDYPIAAALLAVLILPFRFPEFTRAKRAVPSTSFAYAMAQAPERTPLPSLRFAWVGDFSEALAAVEIGGKYGYLDSSGEMRIAPSFQGAAGFSGGLAPVLIDGRWGYVDVTGGIAIAPAFAWAGGFHEGRAAVSGDSGYYFIDSAGVPIGRSHFSDIRDFSGGLAAVRFGTGEDYAWGFIDRKGSLAIPPLFTEAPSGFSEGLARVQMETERPWRAGFIDSTGGYAIDTLYDAAADFHEGLAAVGRGEWRGTRFTGSYGYVDRGGRPVIAPGFTAAGPFRDGRALVRLAQGGSALIDRTGRVVRAFPADVEVAAGQDGSIVTYRLRGGGGLIDLETGAITEATFTEAGPLRQGWARVRFRGAEPEAWAFIGGDGAYMGGGMHVASH